VEQEVVYAEDQIWRMMKIWCRDKTRILVGFQNYFLFLANKLL
jgi:hypothetical protein